MKKKQTQNATNPIFVETLQKIRGDWGCIKPYTRIFPNKKNYNRKLNRKLERSARNELEE